jgi:hypothetical protein
VERYRRGRCALRVYAFEEWQLRAELRQHAEEPLGEPAYDGVIEICPCEQDDID